MASAEEAMRAEVEWLDEQIAAARSLAIAGMYSATDPAVQEQFRAIAARLAGVRRAVAENGGDPDGR